MCFRRSSGVTKCKWNRVPKCTAKTKDKDAPNGDLFRSGMSGMSKECPTPSWKYMESIDCSDGFFSNSECRINHCLGKLVPSTATCNCRGFACNWSYSHGTTSPTCISRRKESDTGLDRPDMQMDFVPVDEELEILEVSEEEDEVLEDEVMSAVCSEQTNPYVICSDGNRDQSKCRRIDCKSNESRCICYKGECLYDRGEPECMEDSLLAPGCGNGAGCNGCDVPPWMGDSDTQCTNFNHEGSQCYRSNCYYPLASTRSTCICEMTEKNIPTCSWNSQPTCFLPTR